MLRPSSAIGLVAALAAMPPVAHADPACSEGVPATSFAAGARSRVATTAACDAFVITGDSATAPWSWGEAELALEAAPALRVSFHARALQSARTLEVRAPGLSVLLRQGGYGFYESEQQFARDGWKTLAGHSIYDPHTLEVERRGHAVTLWIDGERIASYQAGAPATPWRLAIGGKGYGGVAPRFLVRRVRVASGQ